MPKEIIKKSYNIEEAKEKLSLYATKGSAKFGKREKENKQRYTRNWTKENVIGHLVGRQDNDYKQLRTFSKFLYSTNGVYRYWVDGTVGLPRLNYILYPKFDIDGYEKKRLIKELDKTQLFTQSVLNPAMIRRIWRSLVEQGVYYGYRVEEAGQLILMDLDPDYCEVRGTINGLPYMHFNFQYFDDKDPQKTGLIDLFPVEFKKGYNATEGEFDKWFPIDFKKAVPFELPYKLPLFAGAFTNFLDNEDAIQNTALSLRSDALKMIVMKLPIDKETGAILADSNDADFFQTHIAQNVHEDISVVQSPFELDSFSFVENKMSSGSDKRDMIKDSAFDNAGLSTSVTGDASSLSGFKIYQDVINARIGEFLDNLTYWVNVQIQFLGFAKSPFGVQFLKVTQFNYENELILALQMMEKGGSVIVPAMIQTGMRSDDYASLIKMEEILGLKELIKPAESEETGTTGIKQETDETAKSKENETNTK